MAEEAPLMAPVPKIVSFVYIPAMRVLLQKVLSASVTVDGRTIGSIGRGYLLFVGVMKGDAAEQADTLAGKIAKLRLFDGSGGKINDRSLTDTGGAALVVSQFTLAGRTEKGNRPDYTGAEAPDVARILYERFTEALRAAGVAQLETGEFGAHMEVHLVNDGPVTLLLES
jgi:D-aminoacyl-tRNA deacylase